MTTPLTITSLSQGSLRKTPRSDEAYWQDHADEPRQGDLPFRQATKIEWPRWSLRSWADHQ